jgi:hypothetical protein
MSIFIKPIEGFVWISRKNENIFIKKKGGANSVIALHQKNSLTHNKQIHFKTAILPELSGISKERQSYLDKNSVTASLTPLYLTLL